MQIVVRFQPFEGWYDVRPIRLRLEEGGAPPQFDPLTGVLTMQLPRGRVGRCRINSLFENDLNLLGILGWCEEILAPAQFDNVARAIEESRHWMVTPWRDLTFVHAVQRPLQAPEFVITNLTDHLPNAFPVESIFMRQENSTSASLCGEVELDGPSTAQLDLVAVWYEPRDDPTQGRPLYGAEMLQMKKRVMALGIPESGQTFEPIVQEYLSFEDDRRILFNTVAHEVEAVRRRAELQQQMLGAVPARQDYLRKSIVQLEQLQGHEFGDTKYRQVNYSMIAASRFREYFNPKLGEVPENVSRIGPEVTVNMLSSAPPAKPRVAHIVPLMRWEVSGDPDSAERSSTRRGAGVRVWLERPWFSSGEGELLAVVFKNMIHAAGDPLYPYLTLWGQDPVHASALPPGPLPTSFRNALSVVMGLKLRENTSQAVNVALFEPVYDGDQDRWFCDIELDTAAAYFPFVRLALARYQQMSIPGKELSPVVLADITQTFPDRSLALIRDPNDWSSLRLTLRGPAPRARRAPDGSMVARTNLVTAQIEQQEAGFNDDTLGWFILGEETVLVGTIEAGNQAKWTGMVIVPGHNAGLLRLVVREFELHPGVDAAGGFKEIRRLVHADVQPL